MSEDSTIVSPADLAERAKREAGGPLDLIDVADSIRADREQWAAWCERMVANVERAASTSPSESIRTYREGQASAFRAAAAMLRAHLAPKP